MPPVGFPVKVNYNTGDVLSAANMSDLSGTVNLLESAQYAAGKNKIINGDFGVWQRGTSFTLTNPAGLGFVYGAADRYLYWHNGSTAGTNTISQQTFTPGTAPVAGYEGTFFQRTTVTTLGTGQTSIDTVQRVEDVRQFAGQTVTVSFWLKSSASFTPLGYLSQNFGTGGSTTVDNALTFTGTTSTSWQRFTSTITLPSISGKTIGTNSFLNLLIRSSTPSAGQTIDIWGVQLEAGSTASPFQTATGTKQGELAACQRYYFRQTAAEAYSTNGLGFASGTTGAKILCPFPVTMRTKPSSVDYSTLALWDTTSTIAITSLSLSESNTTYTNVTCVVASGLTTYRPYMILANNSTSAYLGFSAEL